MKTCSVDGCNEPGAFSTRSRPTWCLEHLREIYVAGGLTLISEFTKPSDYLLTRCNQCGFEGHYKFEYVLDRNRIGEKVCKACYWRAWAKSARSMSGASDHPVDVSAVRDHAEQHGYTYLRPLTDPSLENDPHATRCNSCGRVEAQRCGDIGWGCMCRRNPKTATAGTKKKPGVNLLKNSKNERVMWWDHTRNDESLWEKAKVRSYFEAWWVCPEGHSFKARVLDVTNPYDPCPECREKSRQEWQEERASYEGKTIADILELLKALDGDILPQDVLVTDHAWGSGYRFRC